MTRPALTDRLAALAGERRNAGLERRRLDVEGRDGAMVQLYGRQLVNFASNDYLGLSQHLDVISAMQEAAAIHGVGSGSADMICGHFTEHAALEREVADWLGAPRALLFGSGYLANLGVQQALLHEGALCVQDKLNHACLLDGAQLARCELKRYPHLDVEGAMRQLQSQPESPAMLATDGVFSMDGDLAPLKELALLARAQNALFYVDDAHGIGVMGPGGRGSVAHAGLTHREVPLQLITLGKALGGYGALLVGREDMIEAVLQTARSYLFTTALPPAIAAAARASVRLAQKEAWRRFKLVGLVSRFRRGAQQLGLPLMESDTPIQPLLLGDSKRAVAVAATLRAHGMLVGAIRPPTVPEGRARLRISISAVHTEQQVDALLDALEKACRAAAPAGDVSA
jgi:8-amino-7-oxononanoate synthase